MARLTVDDLGFEAPAYTQDQVAEIALELFGVSGELKRLEGERDQNTRITDRDGRRFLLKISGAMEKPETVDFQVKALQHIKRSDPDFPVPRLRAGRNGEVVQIFVNGGDTHRVRLMTYLAGIPYADAAFPSTVALEKIGRFLARLNLALKGFSHPASTAFMPWDIGNGLVFSDQFRGLIPNDVKSLCEPLIECIEQHVYPKLDSFRQQVIHQDGHGSNLLRASIDSEEVAGIIDFGDMIYGPLISDVAITVSHFMETANDPAAIAAAICSGFSSKLPLRDDELDVLLDLVITRQILTLQLFEFTRLNLPHKSGLDMEEKPRIISSLRRLSALDNDEFTSQLKISVGDA